MNLKRMRDDTTSTSHTGSGEPACEVCGARGHTVTGTAQAQGGLVFPIDRRGEGKKRLRRKQTQVLLLSSAQEDSSTAERVS